MQASTSVAAATCYVTLDALRSSLNSLPLYQLNTASNWTEFSAALSTWDWPTQSVVYSDDQGHIAYHAIGKVPLRPAGLAGIPSRDAAHEWQGYIPFEAMPNSVDPPSGFLATANSRVTTDSSPYPLALEWVDPYRIERNRFGIGFDEDILLRLAIITPRTITARTPATTRTIVTVSILSKHLLCLIYCPSKVFRTVRIPGPNKTMNNAGKMKIANGKISFTVVLAACLLPSAGVSYSNT